MTENLDEDYAYNIDAPNPLALILGDIKLPSLAAGIFMGDQIG